jgi:hypothetical protein
VLSDFQISIPEGGTITAEHPPLVTLTFNSTRGLHDALKRSARDDSRQRPISWSLPTDFSPLLPTEGHAERKSINDERLGNPLCPSDVTAADPTPEHWYTH